jgi:WD40 repeat protein
LAGSSHSREPTELIGEVGTIALRVSGIAFSFDGRTLTSGSQDTTVLLWDVSTPGK